MKEEYFFITVDDYFAGYSGDPRITGEHIASAGMLLKQVNSLLGHLRDNKHVTLEINPKTKTLVSGTKNGGWRPRDCIDGAWGSSHKVAKGVDVFDSDGDIDNALNDQLLEEYGLYREHPSQTRGWCHLTNRAPKSGRRTFIA